MLCFQPSHSFIKKKGGQAPKDNTPPLSVQNAYVAELSVSSAR